MRHSLPQARTASSIHAGHLRQPEGGAAVGQPEAAKCGFYPENTIACIERGLFKTNIPLTKEQWKTDPRLPVLHLTSRVTIDEKSQTASVTITVSLSQRVMLMIDGQQVWIQATTWSSDTFTPLI